MAILDTSICIDHREYGLYQDTVENLGRAYISRHFASDLTIRHIERRARFWSSWITMPNPFSVHSELTKAR